ncbi:hypothetical protein M413DRAFT_19920 [Hebeloma cylindrosporum]|uniref:Beta-lactamase-related domain-containing protein n=1 Tax=Hebeloma cylindrosporum TaxID=76867 RepID=A0A0C2YCU0_HEBCY|nr:hypothetical protein M413DRAFT_19920 [Hebeloma cylindrosporum h7]
MVKLTPSGKDALDNLIASAAHGGKIPGFVFGATTADEEIYFKGSGNKVFGDPSSGEVDPDSTLWVCSQTKMIAHIAALQLIEQGKFTQSTPVSEFFPEFANPIVLDDISSTSPSFKQAKTVVTVKHLLNFSSGLYYPVDRDAASRMPNAYAEAHDMQDPHSTFFKTVKVNEEICPESRLKFEPGTDFAYGYSSDVLGFIVEKVSGKTLEQYFQDHIFKPLGMKGSFYLTPELEENMLSLTYRRNGVLEAWNYQPETTVIERDPTKVSRHLGGVGLYISLRHYLTLLRHLLQIHAGTATNPILKQETVHEMFVPTLTDAGSKSVDMFTVVVPPGGQWSTALALTTTDWPKRRRKGSAFWSGWAGTYFWIDPTTGIAAVFGTQIIPTRDIEVIKTFASCEETLYAGLA